ncbi:choice-of-anchor A family protein [Ideonella livida]|uniref:Choice-of-anchor A family protein n=1 Tax=Ideonella livida TaxID=2707176 RepID=A0A7C9PIA6_9BURK|nr:choice-of-anchor A family protein [Ideonella livida]NDY92616.1 choice-of-anchor A family protein [Ideonella livida]
MSAPTLRTAPAHAAPLLLAGWLGLAAGSGWAAAPAPLGAQQVLREFNLVTLGQAQMASHVDGRSYIGGTLTGQGAVFAMHPQDMPASSTGYAGLTVAGNASGLHVTADGATVLGHLSNANINNGPVVVGGNASNSNFNGSGGSYVYGSRSGVNANSGNLSLGSAQAATAVAQSTDFASVLHGLSDNLASLASTGSHWNVNGGKVTFHAVADAQGLAVFDLTAVDDSLLALSEFEFDLGSATTVIFNTDVSAAQINANFLGGSAQAIGSRTIWNFYNATSLNLGTQFGGAVLATEATLTHSNNIEGGVFVQSLVQYGEIHLQAFSGTVPTVSAVPEPGTWALLLAGLAPVLRRARRAALHGAGRGFGPARS